MNNTITSYEELLKSKQDLKSEIDAIEAEIKDHKLIKLSNVFTGHESSKDTILESISSIGDVVLNVITNTATVQEYSIFFNAASGVYPLKEDLTADCSGNDRVDMEIDYT